MSDPPHEPAKKPKLVIFPGEGEKKIPGRTGTPSTVVTVGRIYVLNGKGESYECAGGPPPGKGYKDEGGHTAGSTPAGHYVLDQAEHHHTKSWPTSVIPWKAKLRVDKGVVQYETGGKWHDASGKNGAVTRAETQFEQRSGDHPRFTVVDQKVRKFFLKADGTLWESEYTHNDFGNWSWDMKRHGHRTPYYIHTTPENEASTAAGAVVSLMNSHGCVHIRPADRDEMMGRGYLKAGIEVEVKAYGQKGPP